MSRIVQWTTDVNNGFGINPPNIKVVSEEKFDEILNARINMFADAANTSRRTTGKDMWCNTSVIMMMKDSRDVTEHMIAIADADSAVAAAGGAPVTATTQGILTMGNDPDRDPPGVLTIHAACAKTPEYFDAMLGILTGGNRLKTYGITRVKANVFLSEVPLYTRRGFQVVSAVGGVTADIVLDVSKLGGSRRKSKSMRSKRIRKTRRRNTKQ